MAVVDELGTDEAAAGNGRALDARVLEEQLRFFFGQTRDAVVGHTAVSIAIVLLLMNQPVNIVALFAWGAATVAVSGLRMWVYQLFPREDGGRLDSAKWRRRFEVVSLLSGGMFGLLPVLFLDGTNFEITAWILLVMAGLAGGALGTLSAYAKAFRLYITAAIGPLVVVLILCVHVDLAIIAVLFVLLALYFMRFAGRFERALVDQISGRLENTDLAHRMTHQGAVLRSVMLSIPNAIAVVEDGGRIVYHNDQFRQLFDLPDDLLQGGLTSRTFNAYRRARGDFDHLDEAAFRDQQSHWERLQAPGSAFGYERVLRDGRVIKVENHPIADGGWVRSWTDVSMERAAAAETARWSHLLQLTLDHVDQGLTFVDADGNHVLANRRFCELVGLPEDFTRLVMPQREVIAALRERGELAEMPAEVTARLDRWDSGEDPSPRIAYERRQANGNWLSVVAIRLPEGGHVRTFTDITSRKQAEISADERRDLLQRTLDHIDQGLSFVDVNGDQILANRRFSELLGLPEDFTRRILPLNEIVAELTARGELDDLPAETSARLDRWEAGEDSSPRIAYERRQANGNWLMVVANRLPDGGHVRTFTDITSRKLAEISAAERRELLEATLSSIDQGVIMRDADDTILVYNNRLSELLDVPKEMYDTNATSPDLYSYHDTQGLLVDPQTEARIHDWQRRRDLGEPVERLEYQRPSIQGGWLHAVFQPLPDGREIRTFTDITAIKRAELELVEKTQFLEAVLGAMEQGILVTDPAGRITLWNDRAHQILDIPADLLSSELTTEGLRLARERTGDFNRADPEVAAYLAHWNSWLESDSTDIFTHERRMANDRWMLVFGRKLPDGGTVRTLTDITERKRDEAETMAVKDEAEKTRERMRAILQSIPVGVLVYDPSMHVEFWNDAYLRYSGFPAPVLAEHPHFTEYSEFIFRAHNRGRDMDLAEFMAYRRRVYESDEKYSTEFFFDATALDVQYIVGSLPDGGRVNVMLDISEQKQAERAALEARDAAEEATRAKSAFLAAMSHEIRTPMNGVIGMAEVLEQTGLDDDQRLITGTIRESGQVLLRIIDDILDFSKIEAGRMELEAEQVDLRAIAESVLDSVAPSAEVKDLDLVLEMEATAPAVFVGDPVRLRQVLLNLAGNAVKFTEAGAVRIVATARPDPAFPSGVRLRFEVSDTGVGIEADRIDQLFQPFRQAEASTTRRFGGTGLGLSICRRLVGMMGGEIGVESVAGRGSDFWFEIPVEPSILIGSSDLDDLDLADLAVLVVARPGPMGDQVAAGLLERGMAVERVADADSVADHLPADVIVADGRLGCEVVTAILPSGGLAADAPGSALNVRPLWVGHGRDATIPPIAVPRPVRREALLRAVAAVLGRASPDVPCVADPKEVTGDDVAAPTVEEAMAAGRLILVVEDNETNRMVVQRQLAILGLAAETAVDGVEALRMWREKSYGLVLTDCHMPNMDGYQLTAAIRAAEAVAGGHVPIVALTANALVGEAERCLEAGMDDYLAKPVRLTVMGETLDRWLKRTGADESPAAVSASISETGSPIDFDHLEQILGSADPEFVVAMLSLFRDSYQSLDGRMRAAIAAGDAAGLRESSHAAKGASANACAVRLRDALEELERMAAAGDLGQVADIWARVEEHAEEVFDFLDTLVTG